MSVKIAFMQLSSCCGCVVSLLDANLGLIPILPKLDIVYWPTVVDFKLDSLKAREDGEIDFGFFEGAPRTKQDTANVKLMREKCKFLILFGTCACLGNVTGLANNWPIEELVKRKFIEAESITTENPKVPSEHVPGFEDVVRGVDNIVNVDAYFAGCPPKTELIVGVLNLLLNKTPFPTQELPYCSDCSLNDSGCLLDEGTLCFGPITSKGCTQKCPDKEVPCVGCFGPSTTVSSRTEKLSEISNNLENLDSQNNKIVREFFSLFLDLPLMGSFIPVGPILPDMPPKSEEIVENIVKFLRKFIVLKVLKLTSDFHEMSNLCDACSRVRGRLQMTRVKRDYEGLPNEEDCLLEQGYICLGPITIASCGGSCIKVNVPCAGCSGPTKLGFFPPGWFLTKYFVDTVIDNFNIGISKKELLTQIKDHIGTFERFTLVRNTMYRGGFKGKITGLEWLENKK